MGFFEFIVVCTALGVTGSVLDTWIKHRTKIAELKLQAPKQGNGNSNVQASIDGLREEMRALRDTTMQYDLSFDSALQRMESRVEHLERRIVEVDAKTTADLRAGR